jgi:ABC-type bacteriocin/lantibiotic exporter with double-glycine peptidase domain
MKKSKKKKRGYFNQKLVNKIAFYIIITCIVLSVVISNLRVWHVMDPVIFWRLLISLAILAVGSALFAIINGIFRAKKK